MKIFKVIAWLYNKNKYYMIKKVLHKKGWDTDTNPAHIEPPQIPSIKETYTVVSDGYYVKLKLHRDPTYITSDLYDFSMSLFDHGKPEEFLLFVRNSRMTLSATVMLDTYAKVQYIHTLVRGEALCQFDLLSADMEDTNTSLTVDCLLKGLGWYFFPVN